MIHFSNNVRQYNLSQTERNSPAADAKTAVRFRLRGSLSLSDCKPGKAYVVLEEAESEIAVADLSSIPFV